MDRFSIDTGKESFIDQIEAHPVLWNIECPEYKNKISKNNAWKQIMISMCPDFKEKTTEEKNIIAADYQRKWKSLRNSFCRELVKRKSEKKSSAALTGRKQYVYFDRLQFLRPGLRKSYSSGEEQDDDTDNEDNNPSDETIEVPVTKRSRRRKPISRQSSSDESLAKYGEQKRLKALQSEESNDEDRLFLLSLVKEMKQIPEYMKLDVKCEILEVFKRARASSTDPLSKRGFY